MTYTLVGLSTNSSYNPFITSINMTNIKPSFSSFHSQLKIYERMLNQQSGIDKKKVFHTNVAFINKSIFIIILAIISLDLSLR